MRIDQLVISILWLSCGMCIAGTAGPVAKKPAWSFGGRALYLHPSLGGNGLGYSTFSNAGVDTFGNLIETNGAPNNIANIVPNWGWGYQLEGAYFITPTNKIDVNWYHYSRETAGNLPPESLYAGSAGHLYGGATTINSKWDAVNVEAGQVLPLNARSDLYVHVGVEYARIVNQFENAPKSLPSEQIPLFLSTDVIDYNGFGPHFGIDLDYNVGYGLGLYASGAGSMLVGTEGQTISGYADDESQTYAYSSGNYVQSNSGVVVPEAEAKLGLKYIYTTEEGDLTFDGGYLWMTYLNVLVSQVGVGIVGSSASISTAANFDLNGLYFGLQWTGYV